ncbi:hypothetical protein [Leptospira ilyithenensis]|uniref:Uncharacterized protein n=1 Tax=Leptospira ilyithenensis TaxID=2484901 RepID=A0A4R9LK92_9LEPT|nr:hypothetical protein [Leptospira ilyithenensis]TGN08006.1 hypothetical protein EHS11_13795 [Leptospira ilyithenensis]
MNQYTYTSENRIESPHKYMYTPYQGRDFLGYYFEDRKNFIRKTEVSDYDILEKTIYDNVLKTFSLFENNDTNTTVLNLGNIISRSILSGKFSEEDSTLLSSYIRKFEVTKKLYQNYDLGFKAPIGQFDVATNYIFLSIAANLFFKLYRNFKMLNVALKVGDLVVSIDSSLTESEKNDLAIPAISMEMNHISLLLNEKEIKY